MQRMIMNDTNYNLTGKKVAILVADGFEQDELLKPREALEDAGALTEVVSPCEKKVKGRKHSKSGRSVKVDVPLDEAQPEEYDGLLLPGGVENPDTLRMNEAAVRFVKAFFEAHKPVAAICHGPWLLVEADAVRGRRVTSYKSIKTDVKNAGGEWLDQEVVADEGIVTSRSPADLKAFVAKTIEEIQEGRHQRHFERKVA